MEISTVTEKGQATIPAKYRKALGIKGGDRILFQQLKTGEIVIRPLPAREQEWSRFIARTLEEELSSPADEEAYGDL